MTGQILRLHRWVAWGLLAVGGGMVLATVGYLVFASVSRGQSDGYEAELTAAERLAGWSVNGQPPFDKAPSPDDSLAMVSHFASLYPGSTINPRYWDDPDWAGPEPFGELGLPEGYRLVTRPGLGIDIGQGDIPTRIRIPDIRLDEPVEGLEIIVEGDSSRYENPDRVVGHIPGTALPGENGNGWYFGHQSNFGTNEGAVFARLGEIFDLFRQDPVYVFIDTARGSYAYRVFGTDVVSRDTLTLTRTNNATVTLVASWPPFVFDQRFLVFAELVGVKD